MMRVREIATRPLGVQAVTAAASPRSPALPHEGGEGALGFVVKVAASEFAHV